MNAFATEQEVGPVVQAATRQVTGPQIPALTARPPLARAAADRNCHVHPEIAMPSPVGEDRLSDPELLIGFATGDAEIAAAFVRRFQGRVYSTAIYRVDDRDLAEDVAKEASSHTILDLPAALPEMQEYTKPAETYLRGVIA